MDNLHIAPTQTVIRRVFVAQLVLLAAVGALVVVGLVFTQHLGSFPFSFFAGCLGGSISLLRRLRLESQAVLEELATSWISSLMPLLYGGLMAAVAYVLFMSGILTGEGGHGLFTSNLFPNFTQPAGGGNLLSVPTILQLRPALVQDFGKMLVWCFLSGYSEKFVAGILQSLEERSGGKDK
jgi:hypothetical protein